jgi:hypothetical protein
MPAIGTTIFFANRSFCGYLDGPWDLKTHRKTSDGPGRLTGTGSGLCGLWLHTIEQTSPRTWRGPERWVSSQSGWLGAF